jgi:hypothetical protein
MKTSVYEVVDEDILELFFGDEQRYSPIWAIVDNHGLLLWEGELSLHPDVGDVLCIDGAAKGVDEFMIVARAYHANTDSSVLIVHNRYQQQLQGMS